MNYEYENDWDEQSDVPYVQMELDIRDVHQLYKAVDYHLTNFPGSDDPHEKGRLVDMKDFLYRMILEYKFQVE